ncbi:MAG: bifunctional adenosylcobinamide kinase/adenosylcobinamide-phosphate guanylyltransferase [Clostridia bacterium]|nr:bifunctional adenosylcobinamide kinase/adenosylcobinamide-phosphate guanylyltransferase [Clostridia bacterium]
MEADNLVLVLGGARSGKSEFAEELVYKAQLPVIYVATAEIKDQEMQYRIELHRQRRPASWLTVEETHNLIKVVEEYGQEQAVMLIDCLTVWSSNLLLDSNWPYAGCEESAKEDYILKQAELLAEKAASASAKIIMVANEVGMGVVPAYPLGRLYRDISGRVNRAIAVRADKVYGVFAGLPIDLKAWMVSL